MMRFSLRYLPLARRCLLAATALASLVAPAAATAASNSDDGNLSFRLAELAQPGMRSASLAQVGSRLALLPSQGAGSLMHDGDRLIVEVRFDHGATASLDALRETGAEIINVSSRYQTVTVAATTAELRPIGALPGVGGVMEVLALPRCAAKSATGGSL